MYLLIRATGGIRLTASGPVLVQQPAAAGCMYVCMHTRRSASSDKFYGAVCTHGQGQASSQRKQRKQTQSRPLLWSRHTSAAPWVSGAPASDFWTTKVRLPAPVAPPGWPSMSGADWGHCLGRLSLIHI